MHGTSTSLGDIAETKAVKQVFQEDVYNLNINSTKSMTGHLLGASGAIEVISCILAMNNSMVPPTINHFNRDENIDPKLNLTFSKPQKKVCIKNHEKSKEKYFVPEIVLVISLFNSCTRLYKNSLDFASFARASLNINISRSTSS